MPTLQVLSQLGRNPAAPISASFGTEGATIGRSPDCVLVLPDPARHISREQARVAFSNGTYVITCLGAANSAIVVNGSEVASGETVALRGADVIVIAEYELRFDLDGPMAAASPLSSVARPPGDTSAIPDDFDPFADPMAEPPPAREARPIPPPPAPQASSSQSHPRESARGPAGDPFALPRSAAQAPHGSGGPMIPPDPFADLGRSEPNLGEAVPSAGDPLGLGLGSSAPGGASTPPSESIDSLFGLGSASADPLGASSPLAGPLSQPNTSGSVDPLIALGASPQAPSPSQPDRTSELDGSFRLPEAIPPTEFGLGGRGAAAPAQSGGAPPQGQDAAGARAGASSVRAGAAGAAGAGPNPGAGAAPVQRGPEPPASQRPPAAHAPPLASEEVRSIAERAADAHRAAFEIPTTTQPTDLLNRLNQAQLDALREQGGGRPAAAPGGSAAGAPAAAGAAPGASSGAARGQAEELAFELLKSLLVGLGLSELPKSPIAGQATAGPPTLSPELMRRLGELLKVATQGTLDLLQVRATVKRELKAEVTIIASMDNNPLKFSPDSQAALAHLLSNRSVRGFMDPVPAMRDAYDDLLAHQVGFVAGMRAAMQGLIARFDPGELETRLTRKSVMDSMLPMTRRSRLWELYQQMFTEISREAEDDFERLFGREFLRAYEEQIDRLKDAQR